MEAGKEDICVKHNLKTRKFYIDGDEARAFLTYERKNNCVNLMHTEIVPELQGRGLGQILAKEALEYVANHGYSLKIECEFIHHIVEKYEPQYLKYMQSE